MTKEQILDMFIKATTRNSYGWSTYQPINVPGYEVTLKQSGRLCADRANALLLHVKSNLHLTDNFVDWGCNNGYFVFELAKNGYQATGIDREERFINVCNTANMTIPYSPSPKFVHLHMTPETIRANPASVALCFSVLHHVKNDKISLFNTFSDVYKKAYIEMDGSNFGYDYLSVYYWDLSFICEANDRYGNGTRLRKTWFCDNDLPDAVYSNIKMTNCLGGRSVFKRMPKNGTPPTVIKRENKKFTHTWIVTDLNHEANMYRLLESNYIPKFINYSDGINRQMEIEFIDNSTERGFSYMEIMEWLRNNGLFIVDINVDQFIRTRNGYVLVDLESIMPIGEITGRLRRGHEVKNYEEQIKYLTKRLQ